MASVRDVDTTYGGVCSKNNDSSLFSLSFLLPLPLSLALSFSSFSAERFIESKPIYHFGIRCAENLAKRNDYNNNNCS